FPPRSPVTKSSGVVRFTDRAGTTDRGRERRRGMRAHERGGRRASLGGAAGGAERVDARGLALFGERAAGEARRVLVELRERSGAVAAGDRAVGGAQQRRLVLERVGGDGRIGAWPT